MPAMWRAARDELEKIAITRAVKEWRRATAAGQPAVAEQIAQGYAGLKPRYLQDVSSGGQEAAVDLMMGRYRPQAEQAPAGVADRLQAYKARKAELGLQGRTPSQSVRSSAAGRRALGVGQPAAPAPAPRGGLQVRKLYKPDSPVATGEHMTELLKQKQQVTDTARGLSPEARQMVPEMYGHKTVGSGPNLRHVSTHEYVPGIAETKKPVPKLVEEAEKKVLGPMQAKGVMMHDVAKNPGNLVQTPQGTKIVDFLPVEKARGADNPIVSYGKKLQSTGKTMTPSSFGSKTPVQEVRKAVFNPRAQGLGKTLGRLGKGLLRVA